MPDYYSEPFITLAGLTHKSALISWGAFYFRVKNSGEEFKLVDDDDLDEIKEIQGDDPGKPRRIVHPPRNDSIGATSKPYGPARVKVTDMQTGVVIEANSVPGKNHCLVDGLKPDTEYAYELSVNSDGEEEPWAAGGRRNLPVGGHTGDEDDDWYFTYYQPYRYFINRVPVFPTIGNHDSGETEGRDDRDQLFDNFYVRERAAMQQDGGRVSIGPGLFYSFHFGSDAEFICVDTSREPDLEDSNFDNDKRLFEHPNHMPFLDAALPAANGGSPAWRVPFGHHPPFCRGPKYGDTKGMKALVGRFRPAGVRLVLSGHEHYHHDGIDYIVTGGAGQLRTGDPDEKTISEVKSWAPEYHFLLVTIDGKRATVRAVASPDGKTLAEIPRKNLSGNAVTEPMVIELP